MSHPAPSIYYDNKFQTRAVIVLPGSFYVTHDPDLMIVTVLGSCVAACIRDPINNIGGLNHFMLPQAPTTMAKNDINSESNRYGSFAMEKLINEIIKAGGKRENLEVKLFGGANIFAGTVRVGDNNSQFVREYLVKEGLSITTEDLGGILPRRIHYWPITGKARRLNIEKGAENVIEKENEYRSQFVPKQKNFGDIELF